MPGASNLAVLMFSTCFFPFLAFLKLQPSMSCMSCDGLAAKGLFLVGPDIKLIRGDLAMLRGRVNYKHFTLAINFALEKSMATLSTLKCLSDGVKM